MYPDEKTPTASMLDPKCPFARGAYQPNMPPVPSSCGRWCSLWIPETPDPRERSGHCTLRDIANSLRGISMLAMKLQHILIQNGEDTPSAGIKKMDIEDEDTSV